MRITHHQPDARLSAVPDLSRTPITDARSTHRAAAAAVTALVVAESMQPVSLSGYSGAEP